jgi:type VI secretion system protein ImpK
MITPNNEKIALDEHDNSHIQPSPANGPEGPPFTLTKNTRNEQSNSPLLLRNSFIPHHPKAGLNPLVDSAAYLFSIIGKLKLLKSYRSLNKLQKELITEINVFQEAAKTQGYSSEYILVSRYALCATFDDIITNTSWGDQGQWDNYSLLAIFNQESTKQERFFLILERIIKDPALYIDVMELMYICLSLGYKGSYRSTEFSNNQLEKITHALYKRIRAYHGDFSRTLSPFIPKISAPAAKQNTPNTSILFAFLITASIIMILFISLGYLLDNNSNLAYQALTHIGKSTPYETHPSEHL